MNIRFNERIFEYFKVVHSMFCSDYKGLDNFGSEYRDSHFIDVYRKCITSLIRTENVNQNTAVRISEVLL